MFGLSELKQTRVYQEAREEGKLEGKVEGKLEGKHEEATSMVIRQLRRKFRLIILPTPIEAQIRTLTLEQVETLADTLLEFGSLPDLERWLSEQI